jgi:hypothetical protein
MGVAALVVGPVAVPAGGRARPLGLLLGIVAVVIGVVGRRRVPSGTADNRGQATGGLGLGVAAAVLAALVMTLAAYFFRDLAECLADAGGDQAAVDACQREFEAELQGG